MNMELKAPLRAQKSKVEIIDCDFHPKLTFEQLRPHLSARWWQYLQTYGIRQRHAYAKGYPFPKAAPQAARRDAWPPSGGLPGSDLDFIRRQHLDFYGIGHAIMNPLSPSGLGEQNVEFSAAMATAANEAQVEHWVGREPRLRASVCVPYEDGEAARKEIRRCAGRPEFAQVFMLSRTSEALGRRRYWPIYEAAVEAGLPVGIHVFGYSGWAATNSGWPSFYIEEMTEHATSSQALVTSFIMEGVFERYPDLKIVLIESGFGWLPALEYIREHLWVTTQPMEEAERPEHLIDVMTWIGFDRVLFASDYPHWDFDDPFMALPPSLSDEQRRGIYAGNAKALYRLS